MLVEVSGMPMSWLGRNSPGMLIASKEFQPDVGREEMIDTFLHGTNEIASRPFTLPAFDPPFRALAMRWFLAVMKNLLEQAVHVGRIWTLWYFALTLRKISQEGLESHSVPYFGVSGAPYCPLIVIPEVPMVACEESNR